MKNLIATLLMFITMQAMAQGVTGRIVDEHNQPVPFVNVVLLSKGDSTFIKGDVTDEAGLFSLQTSCKDGIVRCSCVGYQTVYRNYNGTDCGLISMKESTTELNGITVKGKRPTVKIDLNKITVDVSHSYLQYLGKVTDILGKIPGLTPNLQLLEGGTPTFVLNGKVAGKKELAAIPASEIKNIVVDSNPSIEYSAGNKGVVYITTKTALGNTLSCEISNTSVFARNYMDMANITVNEKYGKVSNLLTVGYSCLKTTQIDNTTENIYLPEKNLESEKERHTHGKGKAFDWFYSMNWDISKRQSLGIQYTGNIGKTNLKEPTWQTINGEEMTFAQRKKGNDCMHSASVNYRNEIDSARNLSFVADYTFRRSDDTGLASTVPPVATGSYGKYHIAGARLSYSSRRKWADIAMGTFLSAMNNKGEYAYNTDTEKYNTDEHLFGVYLSLSKQFRGFHLQGGFRIEADHRKLDSSASGIFADSTEWHIFPNLIIKKTLTEKSSIGLTVGQTIARPSFSDLNPGLYYYDAISYKVGNPHLKSTITTDVKLSYNYGNLFTSVAYNRSQDKIIQLPAWTEKTIDNKNIKWMPLNFNKASGIVATAIYYYSFGPVQGDITGAFTKPFVRASYMGEQHNWNSPSWYFSLNAQCSLGRHSLVALDGSFDSGGTSMLFEHEKSWVMNLTYMHRMLKNKLTLIVALNDMFHTDRGNNWTMKYNNLKTTMNTNGDTRSLMVKLTYNLGKLQLDSSRKRASTELLDRL